MPTGYTQPIQDGISFNDFVMRCARAMGALVMMREEPLNATVPERFEPSDYSKSKLKEAWMRLEWLKQVPDLEAEREAKKEYEGALERNKKAIQDAIDLRNKYQAMIAKVVEWQPPTSDHVGLKDFMLQQLRESIRFDADESHYVENPPVLLATEEWRKKKTSDCLRDIEYHEKAYAEEFERTEARNRWIEDLRRSLAPGSAA